MMASSSSKKPSMYQPYMALGLVCDGSATGCRPCSHQVGLAYFLTTPVDGARTLHLYDIDLQLKGISRPIPSSWLSSLLSSSSASTTTAGSSTSDDDGDDDDIDDDIDDIDDGDSKDNIDIRMSHLAACYNLTFGAVRNAIIVFNRLVPYAVWHRADTTDTDTHHNQRHNISAHDADITVLSMLGGTQLLVSVDADQVLAVWPVPHSVRDLPSKTQRPLVRIALPPDFVVTCVAHPQTYVNKVLLGAKDGRTMLVNVNSKKIIHVFNAFEAPVTALEPAPIVDVVAVGLANGSVHLHNFRVDKTIMTFSMTDDNDIDTNGTNNSDDNDDDDDDDDGMSLIATPNSGGNYSSGDETSRGIRTLSFRSDGVETLAVGDFHGNLFVWDLNERRLACEARGVHKRGLCYAQFLAGDSLLVSAGSLDNSIKVHVFDNGGTQHNLNSTVAGAGVVNDHTPIRILRSRDGHYLPPTTVRFCGYDGLTMVSAGLDRELRLVCAVREVRNQAFSQRAAADKRGKRARKAQRKRDDVEIGQRVSDGRMTLPPVIDLAARNTRERDSEFANIVSVHRGRTEAYAWRMMQGAAHKQRCVLRPPVTPGGTLQLTYLHEKQKQQQQRNDALRDGQKRRKVELRQRPASSGNGPQDKEEGGEENQKHGFVNIPGPRTASCVAMSTCGNYAYVGFSDGTIHSFNLQSGLHQGVFAAAELIAPANLNNSNSQWPRAHTGPVTSLCVDGCGDTLASAAMTEVPGKIKLWNAHTRVRDNSAAGDASSGTVGGGSKQDIDIDMNNRSPGGSVTKLVWCETSDLLAVAVTDLCVSVYDARTRALARSFEPAHAAAIVDMCFDPCGRRLVTAALDSTIRTWDLPSGVLAHTLHCNQAPTAIAVCPNGDFLASTHANCLAVKLWVNCERFGLATATATATLAAAAATGGSAEEEKKKGLRRRRRRRRGDDSSSSEEDDKEGEDDEATQKQRKKTDDDDENGDEDYFHVPLSDNIATLSSRPTNAWTVLPHVREMEERNRPIDGVKKGANAPFFLPTVKGLSFQLDTTSTEPSTGGDAGTGTGTGTNDHDEHNDSNNAGSSGSLGRPRPRVLIDRRGTTDNDAQVVALEEEEEEELSRLGQLLLAGRTADADRLLKRSDAKTADSLIRSLSTRRAVQLCGEYLADALGKATCVELTQGHLHVFLTCHGETLAMLVSRNSDGSDSDSDSDNDEEMVEEENLLERLVRQQDGAWTRLRGQLSSVACLAGLFSGQV